MAKDNTFYFPHDYNARNDIKIKKLFANHGWIGYGLFWAIIEELYNNANALPTDYESIAFDLRSEVTLIKSIINDFDLFQIKDDFFGSLSIQRRLEDRNNKTTKARESAFKRWNKCESNANALPTQSDSNAIKESKVKEIINYNPMGFEEPKKADNDNDNEKDFIDNSNFLNTEGKDNGQYSFGVVVEKPKKNKKSLLTKISFNDSLIFDKVNFKNRFPNWSKEKLLHYYNSALSYSVEGNKYVDWGMAINNWASRDETKGMKFKSDAPTEISLEEERANRREEGIANMKARGLN
jgi:hypothetical protein